MSHTTLDETQVKELFKQAIVELVQERKDLLHELVAEIVEDVGMLKAIREGQDTAAAHRDEVSQALEGAS